MPRRTQAPDQYGWPSQRRESRHEPASSTRPRRPVALMPAITNAAGKVGR